jgi:hypothetical protein
MGIVLVVCLFSANEREGNKRGVEGGLVVRQCLLGNSKVIDNQKARIRPPLEEVAPWVGRCDGKETEEENPRADSSCPISSLPSAQAEVLPPAGDRAFSVLLWRRWLGERAGAMERRRRRKEIRPHQPHFPQNPSIAVNNSLDLRPF